MTSHISEGSPTTQLELQAVLPDWCALKPLHALCCLSVVVCFLFFSYIPVANSVVWHDVAASKLQSAQELLPLADGVRHIEIGSAGIWLIQSLYQWGGAPSLSIVFTLLQTLAVVLLTITVYRFSRSLLFAALAPILFTAAVFFEINGLSRATFGLLMYSSLLLLLTDWQRDGKGFGNWAKASRWDWVGAATLFCVWVNFHVSFVIGLIVLLAYALGQFWKNPTGVRDDDEFRARVWLFEMMLVVTLLTPNGARLWSALLWFPDNPVFNQLGGFHATSLAGWHGIVIALFWMVWIIASRKCDQISASLTIAAIALTALTAVCTNCIVWLVPIMLVAIADLLPGSPAGQESKLNRQGSRPIKFAFTLLAVLFVWIGICFSPIGSLALSKTSRTAEQAIGDSIPIAATTFIKAQDEPGLMWCPAYWSGWMQSKTDRPVFANGDLYRIPEQAVMDYQHIYAGDSNWARLADQYAVSTLVVDKRLQKELFRHLRTQNQDWKIDFEDSVAVVARRVYR